MSAPVGWTDITSPDDLAQGVVRYVHVSGCEIEGAFDGDVVPVADDLTFPTVVMEEN